MYCQYRKRSVTFRAYALCQTGVAFHIGSTPNFLYFDLYLNTTYAAHYVYFIKLEVNSVLNRVSRKLMGNGNDCYNSHHLSSPFYSDPIRPQYS